MLHRPRLLDRLDQLAALTVIQAPPGYGKSTLASTWGRHRLENGDTVIWLTARAEHNSADAFLHALHDAMSRAGVIVNSTEPPASRTTNSWDGLAEAIEHSTAEQLIVIVDDAGHLTDTRLCEDLAGFIDRVPAVHLLVSSRFTLALADIAGHHQLEVARITANDLTFTATELQQLGGLWGWAASPQELQHLLALCGGWPELSKRVLAESSPDAIRTTAAEGYLRSVVLPHLAAANVLDAALALSLTPVVGPPHLAALHSRTERSVSTPRAGDQLRLGGILTLLPGPAAEWRFVPLLRHVLLEGVTTHLRDETADYHRLFAEALYEANADLGRVLEHARAGGHWRLLSRLWARHSLTLMARHLPAAQRAYDNLPSQATEQRPVLALAAAILRTSRDDFAGRTRASRIHLEVVDVLAGSVGGDTDIDEYVTAMSSVMVSQRLRGDLVGAARTGDTVAGELSRRAAAGELASPSRAALFSHQRSVTSMLVGDMGEAIAMCMRAYEAASIPDGEFVAAIAAGHLAILHHVVGSPEEAAHWLELARGIDLAGHPFDTIADRPIQIIDAYLATNRLEPEPARKMITEGTALTIEMWPFAALAATAHSHLFEEPRVALTRLDHLRFVHRRLLANDSTATRILDRCVIDTLLALGEVNRAERMMLDIAAQHDRSNGTAHQTAPSDLAWLRASYTQMFLITGNDARAQRLATAALWAPDVVVRDRIDMLMIKAVASRRLGDQRRALEAFRQAGVLAAQLGAFHAYFIVPEAEVRALAEEAGTGLPQVVEDHLSARGSIFPDRVQFVELTPRELHVIREMRHHTTVSALGQALHLSVNTVKKHLAAINSKLGVHDRRAALLQAERLGFFDAAPDDVSSTTAFDDVTA
ncbi:helix-turn-helix transcriptional regulator [Agromyces ramosus]|uniref:LuxR family maltose regulon positive regulatory protein n=1 Tax=Agromyces ramosus TaxID=33879 RepID=A0ABU0RA59_9MICO|nr:LuxR C-terminal-related transcriptional regulator [Agromyces ramosus]MDQ0894955.1 LuxR family maltose regulon positive regulatory protein [Agromyces ramosus]